MGQSSAAPPIVIPAPPADASAARLGPCEGPKAHECIARFEGRGASPEPVAISARDLASAYVAGGLDDATRTELVRALATSDDARAGAAYAKVFEECAAGTSGDTLKFAARGTSRLAGAGRATDPVLVAGLWSCFVSFAPSKNGRSINLVKDLQSAVMDVKDASYGPKAITKLSAPVTDPKDPAQGLDEIQFWQLTSVRLLGELRFAAGVRPLVKTLLTPAKQDLLVPIRLALTKMPREAEAVLIAALDGSDPELAALATAFPSKDHVPRLGDALGSISRPPGSKAVLAALEKADNDENRTVLATELTMFPSDATIVKAFLAAYRKVPASVAVPMMGGANARALMAQAAASFFDPSLTEWLLKEMAAATGDDADAMMPAALPGAIKLMTAANSKLVGDVVRKIPGVAIEKAMYASALAVLDRCKKDVACHLKVLDTPVPASPPAAKMGHVKAAWMAAIHGDASTRTALVSKMTNVKDGSVRGAMVQAIDHLSPQGDVASAEKLEAFVAAEKAAGNHTALDELVKVALKLRARAL